MSRKVERMNGDLRVEIVDVCDVKKGDRFRVLGDFLLAAFDAFPMADTETVMRGLLDATPNVACIPFGDCAVAIYLEKDGTPK